VCRNTGKGGGLAFSKEQAEVSEEDVDRRGEARDDVGVTGLAANGPNRDDDGVEIMLEETF
jgi:hypothetical protein